MTDYVERYITLFGNPQVPKNELKRRFLAAEESRIFWNLEEDYIDKNLSYYKYFGDFITDDSKINRTFYFENLKRFFIRLFKILFILILILLGFITLAIIVGLVFYLFYLYSKKKNIKKENEEEKDIIKEDQEEKDIMKGEIKEEIKIEEKDIMKGEIKEEIKIEEKDIMKEEIKEEEQEEKNKKRIKALNDLLYSNKQQKNNIYNTWMMSKKADRDVIYYNDLEDLRKKTEAEYKVINNLNDNFNY